MHLVYDVCGTWEDNARRGPSFAAEPERSPLPTAGMKRFLGRDVGSRIGISAGLLLNSQWVRGYAVRGFDLLTYKTVRSVRWPSHPLPNWVFVESPEVGGPDSPVRVADAVPSDPAAVSSAVCFGMPSVAPEEWRRDIAVARRALAPGQMLIVSVVGTPGSEARLDVLAEDFAQCAAWAIESGADAIEANLSCPNVCSMEGSLYHDLEASRTVARGLHRVVGGTPLLLKIGAFPSVEMLRGFLRAMDGLARGVTLVNGISRPVVNRDGRPAFGPGHLRAGVLGRAIHEPSVRMVSEARRWVIADRLDLEIAAVGGVSRVGDFEDFFRAGASAVLCGSSPMYCPGLALEARRAHPEW